MPQDILSILLIIGTLFGVAYVYLTVKLDQRYQRIIECEKAHKNKDELDKVRQEISQEFHDSVQDRFNKVDIKLDEINIKLFTIAGRSTK